MDRREFLLGAASLALVSRAAFGQPRVLRASITRQNLVGAAHPSTEVWSYNASVPGPELRFKQGERLRVEVENALPVQTTVHWHGIRLPNAMDG
ncbi:MAG: multicopper oxidase domain-containing protein, partial [Burkholderiales bacterium]